VVLGDPLSRCLQSVLLKRCNTVTDRKAQNPDQSQKVGDMIHWQMALWTCLLAATDGGCCGTASADTAPALHAVLVYKQIALK
jgi:hypothetical protein